MILRKITSGILVVAALTTNVHMTLGADDAVQFAESDDEIRLVETQLSKVVEDIKQQELKELNVQNPKISMEMTIENFQSLVKRKRNALEKLKSYKDLKTEGSFDDTVKMLKDKKYPVDETSLNFYREIDTYKQTKKGSDPAAIVQYFNAKAGLKDKAKNAALKVSFIESAYAISYTDWKKLTTAEKLLIVTDPKSALVTDSLAKIAFQWTQDKFGMNGLGDKSDGYRHGIWNALMTRDISRAWAEAYATAHEDKTQTELQQKESDGYYKYQHRNMDLNNNKIGRDQIKWYEFSFNCTDATVKTRISNKLTNKTGDIYWLHN